MILSVGCKSLSMLTLYFLRHAQTQFSKDNRFCGWLDPPLSDIGFQMAQAFSDAYHLLPWKAIYVSSSLRAQQTVFPLAQKAGLSLEIESNLREISYGAWEGLLHEDVKKQNESQYINWTNNPVSYAPQGGETAIAVENRALTVLKKIKNQHTDGSILIVSHKATLRILICSLLGIDIRYYRERLDYPVAALTCFEVSNHGTKLKKFADISYLPHPLQDQPGT